MSTVDPLRIWCRRAGKQRWDAAANRDSHCPGGGSRVNEKGTGVQPAEQTPTGVQPCKLIGQSEKIQTNSAGALARRLSFSRVTPQCPALPWAELGFFWRHVGCVVADWRDGGALDSNSLLIVVEKIHISLPSCLLFHPTLLVQTRTTLMP
jgi:hypothetical protein